MRCHNFESFLHQNRSETVILSIPKHPTRHIVLMTGRVSTYDSMNISAFFSSILSCWGLVVLISILLQVGCFEVGRGRGEEEEATPQSSSPGINHHSCPVIVIVYFCHRVSAYSGVLQKTLYIILH